MSSYPERPHSPPPSPLKRSLVAHRRKREVSSPQRYKKEFSRRNRRCNSPSSSVQKTNKGVQSAIYVEDLRIAAAIRMNASMHSNDYYAGKVKDISLLNNIEIPSHFLFEVIRGVEEKCASHDGVGPSDEPLQHFMTCSPEWSERYRKKKAVMKRPRTLAPSNSPVYKTRHLLKERKLESKTMIDQTVHKICECLRNDASHIKYIIAKKACMRNSAVIYKKQLHMRYFAVGFVKELVDKAISSEMQRLREREDATQRYLVLREKSCTVIAKYYRRFAVIKERNRIMEEEKRIEEAEEKKKIDKQRQFLERIKIRMTLLQL